MLMCMGIFQISYDDFYKFATSLGIEIFLITFIFFLSITSYHFALINNDYFSSLLIIIITLGISVFLIYWGSKNWYNKQQKPYDKERHYRGEREQIAFIKEYDDLKNRLDKR